MKTSDFDYELPPSKIAQTPVEPRDQSRLLVLNRADGSLTHRRFLDVVDYLQDGDVMVLNQSRVIPARFMGRKRDGGARVELFLLNRTGEAVWEALAKPGKRLHAGTVVEIESGDREDRISAVVLSKLKNGTVRIHLDNENLLESLGNVPLPPYIHTRLDDSERYQTVYAKTKGSVAAPTAGLHFTLNLLQQIKAKGVELIFVTLHVGLGSFMPVKIDDPRGHSLHQEYCELSSEVADKLNRAKKTGRRIIGVGTTAVRTLEWTVQSDGLVRPCKEWNDLYILPGYRFRMVDAMITNFHLPRSTLLMLVSAFAGREQILEAYSEAIRFDYRFYSFGDAMFII
ncbi:MAG: tRNA preQ1(34) S-adenosylmethionine ribosyltransferase-isomerase QueA [Chloroflexota bacterium]|nr:tRNA preQ1(34) S-adenosylmethionine ribosyltransferase-isomerase QueA [Chloroflexota bacterium]